MRNSESLLYRITAFGSSLTKVSPLRKQASEGKSSANQVTPKHPLPCNSYSPRRALFSNLPQAEISSTLTGRLKATSSTVCLRPQNPNSMSWPLDCRPQLQPVIARCQPITQENFPPSFTSTIMMLVRCIRPASHMRSGQGLFNIVLAEPRT